MIVFVNRWEISNLKIKNKISSIKKFSPIKKTQNVNVTVQLNELKKRLSGPDQSGSERSEELERLRAKNAMLKEQLRKIDVSF